MNKERLLGIVNNLLLEMQEAGIINSVGINKVMRELLDNTKEVQLEQKEPDYKKGFEIMYEFFDIIHDEDKPQVHKQLEELGL